MPKEIKLTRGLVAIVDDDDFEYINQWKWHARKDKNTYYACRTLYLGGGAKNEKKKLFHMHRVIMKLEDKLIKIDHRDRNGLNNQKSNLRYSTNSENGKNRTAYGSSKYLGVSFDKESGKWMAQIRINGKRKYIGRFLDEIDAAVAYDSVAKIHHGEFANPNFK